MQVTESNGGTGEAVFALLPERRGPLARSLVGSLVLHALPFLLAMMPVHLLFPGGGPGDSFAEPTPSKKKKGANRDAPPVDAPVNFGVVLWPEAVESKVLRIPPPADPRRFARRMAESEQLELPFTGVYLIYQDPDLAPPAQSPVMRGAPADFRFRSTDLSPLHLDARQALPGPVELERLGALELSFVNHDIFRNAVELEVIAVSTSGGAGRRQSLGSLPMPGGTPLKAMPDDTVHRLRYPIPARVRGTAEELLLRFHLAPFRAGTAPRVRLKSFRFVTRG